MKKTTSMNSVLIVENISVPFCKQRWHDAQRVNGIDSINKGDSVTRKARGHSHKIIRRRIKRRSQQNDCICMSHVTTREFIVQNKDRKKATTIFWFVRSVTTEAMLFLLVLFFSCFLIFFSSFFSTIQFTITHLFVMLELYAIWIQFSDTTYKNTRTGTSKRAESITHNRTAHSLNCNENKKKQKSKNNNNNKHTYKWWPKKERKK